MRCPWSLWDVQACHACVRLHAYAMNAYADLDMQVHISMQMNACACIGMHGMHIPLIG